MSPPPNRGGVPLSRAEKFEDEKRRIVESCFAKQDASGGLAESYITHIRIHEDAQYPQTPPPPDSAPSNKKERIIVVAVRNTGRVRMHKGRENPNGTFSIGKSWNLEDLTAIESYSHLVPQNNEDYQRKEWGGDVGFTVTIQKPYFWAAGTSKEKDFFIASLVKIYRKYTQGKVPEMLGFSSRELDAILGPGSQAPVRRTPDTGRQAPFSPPANMSNPNLNGMASPPPSSQGFQRPPQPPRPTRSQEHLPNQQRSPSAQGRTPPPGAMYPPPDALRPLRPRPSQEQLLRQAPSREGMRPPQPLGGTGTSSVATSQRNLTPQSSRSEMMIQRSESPDSSRSMDSRGPRRQPKYPVPPEAPANIDSRKFNGLGISNAPGDRFRPNGPNGVGPVGGPRDRSPQGARPSTSQDTRPEEMMPSDMPKPPERRRPPMIGQDGPRDPAIPAPLASPRYNRDLAQTRNPPSQDSLDAVAKMPGGFVSSPTPPIINDRDVPVPAPLQIHTPPPLKIATPTPPPPPPQEREPEPAPTPAPVSVPVPVPDPAPVEEPEPSSSEPVQSPASEEEYRPGLGPMFKRKGGAVEVANKWKKVASAAKSAGAFKPRAGGALDRLKKLEAEGSGEQDGITGVFQAPKPAPLSRTGTDESMVKSMAEERDGAPTPVQPLITEDLPSVTVSSPLTPTPMIQKSPESVIPPPPAPRSASPEPPPLRTLEEKEEARKRRRRSQYQAKYLSSLGIESSLIDTRALEFDAILSDLGWGVSGTGSVLQGKKLDFIEADLRRELARVEAGSWLGTGVGNVEHQDERVEQVEKLLDKAIQECEELEGLLTLYGVELSSLNEDIAFIEAQSQGLQVQTANQKLLQTELQNLIQTVDIAPQQLTALKDGQIGQKEGLEAIEAALMLLYKAMITIDPNIRSTNGSRPVQTSRFGGDDLSEMRALQEKRQHYISESTMFLDRLKQYMEFDFARVLMDTTDEIKRRSGSTGLDVAAHDIARRALWKYSPLMLFTKEIDMISWDSLIRMYQLRVRPVYQEEFKNNFDAWKRMTRKPSGDESELLWTSADKESEGLGTTARKLTVKRSQTLARTLRNASGDKADKAQIGRLYPFEAFAGALEEMAPLVFTEQNFIVDFFHANSTENLDFPDAVVIAPPDARRGTNLMARKAVEPDRTIAQKIKDIMEELMGFWPQDLNNMVQWATTVWGSGDPLQGIGIMQALDRCMLSFEDSNQEYLLRTLQKVHAGLAIQFNRVLDEQIRKIEETKVKIKKRKGVIDFMRIFPAFSAAVENMLAAASDANNSGGAIERTDTRNIVDEAYNKINKQMFDSLKTIAKESPGLALQSQQGMGALAQTDPEDKEALNFHISMIENMNHYVEEVEEHNNPVLIEWKGKAREEMEEHLGMYVDSVVRRPLGKLLDFLDTTTPQLSLTPSIATTTTASTSMHSKATLRKLLTTHDPKDMRRGADALRKRVEKHFGEGDDPSLCRDLISKVLKRCEDRYIDIAERAERARRDVFEGDESVSSLGWGERDVRAAFKR
ncbi:hypothetical protein NA57DRAFT_69906 [Rhizodiscina lignyota]|uniref:Exocyst complex component Sec3 PIP2-binding N-terminal domain-containing protein n=1 Tax=Rhizodiscina lignyota TaxID=1504668 RepID=A0A9P4MA94_9PEZI|nr:hypothetical protein NA57DRAFT_69906 [Rhizodiscina lignyota]